MASLNRTCSETHPAPYPRERLRRSGRVIRELTLADYHGVVTSDRYAGYNWLDPA